MDMMMSPGGFEFGNSEPDLGIEWRVSKSGNYHTKYNNYRIIVGFNDKWFTIYKYDMRCHGLEQAIRKGRPKKKGFKDYITFLIEEHIATH